MKGYKFAAIGSSKDGKRIVLYDLIDGKLIVFDAVSVEKLVMSETLTKLKSLFISGKALSPEEMVDRCNELPVFMYSKEELSNIDVDRITSFVFEMIDINSVDEDVILKNLSGANIKTVEPVSVKDDDDDADSDGDYDRETKNQLDRCSQYPSDLNVDMASNIHN